MEGFDLGNYKPEKIVEDEGFPPFKGKYVSIFNYARIEDYQGDKDEFKGHEFFRYELVIQDDVNYGGRKLWASYDLQSAVEDKSGKTKVQKLADLYFTLGLDFGNKKELLEGAKKLVEKTVSVSCYYFKGSEDKMVQMHKITGEVDPSAVVSETTPF